MKSCKTTFVAFTTLLISSTTLVFSQCNTNTSICTPGIVGPFDFNTPGVPVSTCLDFIGPSVSYITLNITTGGSLEMLIDANDSTGFIDVAVFNIPPGLDPCVAILDSTNEIGCNYASNSSGCNQFGTAFPCPSSVPAPVVSAGDELMIVVENWSGTSFNFTLELGNGAQTGPPSATINPPSYMVTSDPPQTLTAANGGGTWTASCGACIVDSTGAFDPAIAGIGTHTVCYDIGASPCDAQDCIDVSVGAILGIEVSTVDISCSHNEVLLEWHTNQETNCSHFTIEKGGEAMDFEYVGTVNAHGNSSEPFDYQYNDPFDYTNSYYRLSEVDFSGNVHPVGVYYTSCNRPDIGLYPNPANDKITLSYNHFHIPQTHIYLYDNTGRLIQEKAASQSGETVIQLADLSPQVYTIKMSDNEKDRFVRFTKI